MSKDQVRFILGTPLLNDAFHAHRWDYVYRLLRGDGQTAQARYTVVFENNMVSRHGGENLPADSSSTLGPNAPSTVPNTPLSSEKPADDIKESESAVGGNNRAPILK